MIKAKTWKGNDLSGMWRITRKIDGVRALWKPFEKRWESRNDKPLYNMPEKKNPFSNDVEVYCGSFKETITRIRASTKVRPIGQEHLYTLDPLDSRLDLGLFENPTAETINAFMKQAQERGDEGLVLRQGDVWLKVKPIETFDVYVTGIIAGKGKHVGKMGALMTEMGRVGTGFTDKDREYQGWVGRMIEAECMHLTADGKFRHARYVRIREDKE